MRLDIDFLRELDDASLSVSERALMRCELARHRERTGDYEGASEAMSGLWAGLGANPVLEGLDDAAKAEVLLRTGVLTGWIGSAAQVEGSQEAAKNLISESISWFEALDDRKKVGEARSDLALCYWREGGFDEARVLLKEALVDFDEHDIEQRARAMMREALVERSANRLLEALRIHNEAAPLFDRIDDHLLTAHFHLGFANLLNRLSSIERREDYIDRALIEYSAASFHFEQAGHERFQACVENNIGFLFSSIGKFDEAHEHLDRAQLLMTRLRDDVHLAQIDETRARVMLADGRTVEAEKTARAAVRTLEKGDELALLAEALTTHGIALARLRHLEKARAALERAAKLAEQAGDLESAGMAALTLVEQIGIDLSHEEIWAAIDRAGLLLEQTQEISTVRRLARGALNALALMRAVPVSPNWLNFTLREAVHGYEAHWIRLALKEAGGQVSHAAALLGFKHHQSLISLLNTRHRDLLKERSKVRKRRHHLMTHSKRKKPTANRKSRVSQLTILHVEDDQAVANVVCETLELEGWKVETCADGNLALEKMASQTHYDLILLDNELPGLNGLQLLKRARNLRHRKRTPMIMLSASIDDDAARLAGADCGLRKPEDIEKISSTITRLLEQSSRVDLRPTP